MFLHALHLCLRIFHNLFNFMNYSEFITLIPLLVLVILLGVYPNIILDTISTSVENLVSVYNVKISTFNNLMIK